MSILSDDNNGKKTADTAERQACIRMLNGARLECYAKQNVAVEHRLWLNYGQVQS